MSRISFIQSISLRDWREDWGSSLASTIRLWRDDMLFIFPKDTNIRGVTKEA